LVPRYPNIKGAEESRIYQIGLGLSPSAWTWRLSSSPLQGQRQRSACVAGAKRRGEAENADQDVGSDATLLFMGSCSALGAGYCREKPLGLAPVRNRNKSVIMAAIVVAHGAVAKSLDELDEVFLCWPIGLQHALHVE